MTPNQIHSLPSNLVEEAMRKLDQANIAYSWDGAERLVVFLADSERAASVLGELKRVVNDPEGMTG